MRSASTTSPFVHCDTEESWVTWTEQSSLMELMDRKQTNSRPEYKNQEAEQHASDVPVPPFPHPVVINRPQYNAILNRINQAKQKTGAFTSWNTSL